MIGQDTYNLGNDYDKTCKLLLAVCGQIRVNPTAYDTFLSVLRKCNFENVAKMVQEKVESICHHPPESRIRSIEDQRRSDHSQNVDQLPKLDSSIEDDVESGIQMGASNTIDAGDELLENLDDGEDNPVTMESTEGIIDECERVMVPSSQAPFPFNQQALNEVQGLETIEKSNDELEPKEQHYSVQVSGAAEAATLAIPVQAGTNSGVDALRKKIKQMYLLADSAKSDLNESEKVIENLKCQLKIKKDEKENLTKQVKEKEKELQKEMEKRKELTEHYSEHIKKLKEDNEQNAEEYKQKLKEKEDLLKQQSEKSKNEVQELTKRINTLEVELQKKKEIAETAERERKKYEDKLEKQSKELEKVELEKKVFELEKKLEIGEIEKKYDGEIAQLERTIKDLEHERQLQVQKAEADRKIAEAVAEAERKKAEAVAEADRKTAEVEKEKEYLRGKCDQQEMMLTRARTTPEFSICQSYIESTSCRRSQSYSATSTNTTSSCSVTVKQSTEMTAIKKTSTSDANTSNEIKE